MTKRKVDDPAAYLESLWGLHDAVVDGLTVLGDIDTVRFDIDDRNKAFLSERDRYPGPQPARITLSGVRSVLVDLAFEDSTGAWISRARISRCSMEPDEPLELMVDIKGAAGKMPGRWPSTVHCTRPTSLLARLAAGGKIDPLLNTIDFNFNPFAGPLMLSSTCACRRCGSVSGGEVDDTDPVYIV